MSNSRKITAAALGVLLTALSTGGYVCYLTGAKAKDIETCQRDIVQLRTEVLQVRSDTGLVVKMAERLDERSESQSKMLATVEARLHGISTQVGLVRSEASARAQ